MKARLQDIIKGADAEAMAGAMLYISNFIEELAKEHGELANTFKAHVYECINGKHFNELTATEEVAEMSHEDVKGEMVTIENVMAYHPDPVTMWDAYVGYNYIQHSLSYMGFDRDTLMKIAEQFWFNDDNYTQQDSKVWWYFTR